MKHQFFIILLFSFKPSRAKDEDLPLCPINFQFLPQKLPMHCRMPTKADFAAYPGMEGLPNMPPPPGKYPMPMPAPLPPGMPMPPGMPVPMPPGMPGPAPMPMPGAMPMMPLPGPMMPMPGQPGHKVPVIVMPFYSPDKSYKKPKQPKRPANHHDSTESSSETDTDTDTEIDTDTSDEGNSSDKGWWKGKRHGWRKNGRRSSKRHHSRRSKRRHNKKKNNILTPVLQYVTNDGYVIYEKTISKGEAKDWLRVNKDEQKPDIVQKREEHQVSEDIYGEGNASVHEEQMKVEIKKDKSNEDDGEKDEGDKEEERDKEEVTTVVAHVKRHHRHRGSAINKLLPPKRAF